MSVADAFVIGGGPAGTSAAIGLARAGWKVVLAEQSAFPRQKVCGECLPAGAFDLLDELGVGDEVRARAGPEIRHVGWMDADRTLLGRMPACDAGFTRWGRAIGRDVLDTVLMSRARELGVEVRQPARVFSVRGLPGRFHCWIARTGVAPRDPGHGERIDAAVVIDAHGSWERGPRIAVDGGATTVRGHAPRRADLLAFKATFHGASLAPGVLPLVALPGGYAGMVVADQRRTTVALCLRRDALERARARYHGLPAGLAVEAFLRESAPGAARALDGARRDGPWLAVGPLRPGRRAAIACGIHRVGNARAEAHPLVGEGMRMALQSSRALVHVLLHEAGRRAMPKRAANNGRITVATCLAQMAMRPRLATTAGSLLQRWPSLLTTAARLAGKARTFLHASGRTR